MSQPWDPPDPDQEPRVVHAGRSNRSIGVILLVVTALLAGGGVSYVLGEWRNARDQFTALPTAPSTTTTLAPSSTVQSTTTSTTAAPATTASTSTLPPTTVAAPVTGQHMVFADGHPLGVVTPSGFVAYQGDPIAQLRQGSFEMFSVVNFIGSRFNAQVRPLDPSEISATCPVSVEPRAADNAEPLGLWIESPTWQVLPTAFTPVPLDDPSVTAVIQLIAANNAISPAPPPLRGSAVLVDLVNDGIPDLLVSATYNDDSIYYRMVVVAADDNPAAATPVILQFGGSYREVGSRVPESRGDLRVDAVVELSGGAPYELFIRSTTSSTRGVTIRDLAGTELGAYTCPR